LSKLSTWLVAVSLCALNHAACAQTANNFYDEPGTKLQSQKTIAPLGPDLFGDKVDMYDGTLSFSTTDVSLPGNNALPVAFTRTYQVKDLRGYLTVENGDPIGIQAPMGDWDIDVPRISMTTIFAAWPANPCKRTDWISQPDWDLGYYPVSPYFYEVVTLKAPTYWHGIYADMPFGGEMLLANANTKKPTQGGPYGWTTKNQTVFSCLASVKNASTGEGFLATTPDGTKYFFDQVARTIEPPLDTGYPGKVSRFRQMLYVTLVQDRFGNTVNYTYDNLPDAPAKLTKIAASDGRVLNITYVNNGFHDLVDTVDDGNGRSWKYSYTDFDSDQGQHASLNKVTLPGGTDAWTIDFVNLSNTFSTYSYYPTPTELSHTCEDPGGFRSASSSGTITHPSGAVGKFTVAFTRLGRSNVSKSCQRSITFTDLGWNPIEPAGYKMENFDEPLNPVRYDVFALTNKEITGPGLATQTWTIGPPVDTKVGFNNGVACQDDTCAGTREWRVTRGDGSWDRYVFGNSYFYNEGKLLVKETGKGAAVLRTETSTYELAHSDLPFPTPVGTSPQGLIYVWHHDGEYLQPLKSRVISQDGVTFGYQVDTFNVFALPLQVTRSSSLGNTRTEVSAYSDNLSKWVIGQTQSVTCTVPASCAGMVESQVDYDPVTALPLKTYSFGKLQQTLTYNLAAGTDQTGTLATVKDGNNNVTTLSSWKRGIPQSIRYPATPESPSGAIRSAFVNNDGTIAWSKDENGYTTNYTYDLLGRLTRIIYPTNDSTIWNDTTQTFAPVSSDEYGVPAGHWKQIVATGNARKETVFDALWRPLVSVEYDAADQVGTQRFIRHAYDPSGNESFTSYASATAPNTTTALSPGLHTTYDVLGRATRVDQDSELGVLTTTTEYLPGFKTKVTSPRWQGTGVATTTSYMAFDEPTTAWPVNIMQPEGAITGVSRDVFGKPLAIVRHNADNSEWVPRNFAYDSYQQLCKRSDLETGTTVMAYDGAGNLSWSAAGLPWSPSTACDDDRTTAYDSGRRADRSYDARGRLTALAFPASTGNLYVDGAGNQSWTYTPDGLPASVTTANTNGGSGVKNTYVYNKRRLLTGESQWQAGLNTTLGLGYGYDGNGNVASNTYPDGMSINYAPNALGQATKVSSATATYAYNARYYPNGALKSFTYGNGIGHTMLQNARGIPDRSQDAYGSTEFLDDSYDYDADGNVAAISDGIAGGRGNRTMTYDGLNRLTDVVSPMYGTSGAHYTYDTRDNLKTVIAPGRNQTYNYAKAARAELLTSVINNDTGATVIGLAYDLQGNLAKKNGLTYTFDFGNRLRQAQTTGAGVETYRYDAFGRRVLASSPTLGNIVSEYGKDGALFYQQNLRVGKTSDYMYLSGSLVAELDLNTATGAYSNRFIHTDALGSPVRVTNGSRVVQEYNEYEPYGFLLNRPVSDGPGYTGHVSDASTGLDYMQQRYYDSGIGRFLSVDPVAANSETGGNFNRFWYANNNPYKFTDPDGRCADGVTCERMAQSFGENPKAGEPLAPFAFAGMGVAALPTVVELGLTALANPATLANGTTILAEATGVTGTAGAAATTGRGLLAQNNRIAGQVGENFLRDTYGGVQQVFRQTSTGARYIDNLVDGIAMESKVGKTSLTSRVRSQIAKDVELMNTPGSGVTSVQWHFFPGKTGAGPTAPTREALEQARIEIVIH
jgi:RHS repeat-associated protein